MPARSRLSRFATIFVLAANEMLGQRSRVISWFFSSLLLIGITLLLYVTAYKTSTPALPLSAAVWSLVVANLMRISWRHLSGMVMDDVQSGNIAQHIRYPMSYISYIAVMHAGLSVTVAFLVPLYALFAYLAGGWPSIPSPEIAIPIALLMMAMSMALLGTIYIFIGIVAFWIENVYPLLWVIDKAMLVLGGVVVPLALLPTGVRTIAEYVPFAVVGFPARVFEPDFLEHAGRLLAIETAWLIIIVAAFLFTWRHAVRHIEVNGG